jgi:signal peptidase I
MEPAFYRGDLLFLTNPRNARYEIGDITVYKIPGQDIPIVHRVLETHNVVKTINGSVFTKVIPVGGNELMVTLSTVFANLSPAPTTSYYSPKETTITSTM